MTEQVQRSTFAADGITAPLRHAVFRRIWLASQMRRKIECRSGAARLSAATHILVTTAEGHRLH